jgi:hypothetical protein
MFTGITAAARPPHEGPVEEDRKIPVEAGLAK